MKGSEGDRLLYDENEGFLLRERFSTNGEMPQHHRVHRVVGESRNTAICAGHFALKRMAIWTRAGEESRAV
jgi:hypothetical protein